MLINFWKDGPPITPYYVGCVYSFFNLWSKGALICLGCSYSFLPRVLKLSLEMVVEHFTPRVKIKECLKLANDLQGVHVV